MSLFLRPCVIGGETAPNDYSVIEDDHVVGRIYLAQSGASHAWVWSVTVGIPSTAYGRAPSLDQAKAEFRAAFEALKASVGPERLAAAIAECEAAGRPLAISSASTLFGAT
jgi:hypothetical protein